MSTMLNTLVFSAVCGDAELSSLLTPTDEKFCKLSWVLIEEIVVISDVLGECLATVWVAILRKFSRE